ncbi:MAG TPA: TerB family tellurite resistance protein [Xanthobacteraceae bacterium]|nr:TerB family tellurite resistance protein [Xanthobacteraceae bacterium]
MLRSLGDFISEITGGARDPARFEETDYRLAAAALLVHVATTDANFDEQERARLRDVLAERFELGAEEADTLIESAAAADREAVDLYQFTSLLNRSCDDEGRRKVVEMMFQVAYADGQLSEFEDNIVWRASELMHVPSRDRVTIRRQVREQNTQDEN